MPRVSNPRIRNNAPLGGKIIDQKKSYCFQLKDAIEDLKIRHGGYFITHFGSTVVLKRASVVGLISQKNQSRAKGWLFRDLSFGCMDRTSAVNVTEYISSKWFRVGAVCLTSDSSLSSPDIVCYLGGSGNHVWETGTFSVWFLTFSLKFQRSSFDKQNFKGKRKKYWWNA